MIDGKEFGGIKTTRKTLKVVLAKFLIPVVILTALTCLVGLKFYSKLVPENYMAESQVLVTPKRGNSETFTMKYANTYSQLMSSNSFLEKVKSKYHSKEKITTDKLKNHLSVSIGKDSQVIVIQASASNPEDSIKLVNALAKESVKYIPKILDTNKLTLVSVANKTNRVVKINKKVYLISLFTIFFVLYYLLVIFYVIFGKKIYFKEQISDILEAKTIYKVK